MANYVILRVTQENAQAIKDAAVAAKSSVSSVSTVPLTPLADLKSAVTDLANIIIDITKDIHIEVTK